jgi:hypothetical protein
VPPQLGITGIVHGTQRHPVHWRSEGGKRRMGPVSRNRPQHLNRVHLNHGGKHQKKQSSEMIHGCCLGTLAPISRLCARCARMSSFKKVVAAQLI